MYDVDYNTVLARLLIAVALGAIIGFERSYHGRPAGLRTHALVSTSSCLLMLLTVFQWDLLAHVPMETLRVDPTRLAQGIMTGIGFLGAGVIMKEKLSIRGLTTATSIWMTASIGIIVGMGFHFAAAVAAALTLVILSVFGQIERMLPSNAYSRLMVRCKRQESISKDELIELVENHSFRANTPSYQLVDEGHYLEYDLTIHTQKTKNLHNLAESLIKNPLICEFSLIPLSGR